MTRFVNQAAVQPQKTAVRRRRVPQKKARLKLWIVPAIAAVVLVLVFHMVTT